MNAGSPYTGTVGGNKLALAAHTCVGGAVQEWQENGEWAHPINCTTAANCKTLCNDPAVSLPKRPVA